MNSLTESRWFSRRMGSEGKEDKEVVFFLY
jgi:hypothetical protein